MESPMKIHFCDLCNESVPQTDLDEGRAFLRQACQVKNIWVPYGE